MDKSIHLDVGGVAWIPAVNVGMALQPIGADVVNASGLQVECMDRGAIVGGVGGIRRRDVHVMRSAHVIRFAVLVQLGKVIVERAVLLHHHDDVIERAGKLHLFRPLLRTTSDGGARR